MRDFGDTLRAAAETAGFHGDADAARELRIELRTYGNYANGRIPKDPQLLSRICRAFGTTPNHLLGFEVPGYQQEAAAIAERLTPEIRASWFQMGRAAASKERSDTPKGRRRRAA